MTILLIFLFPINLSVFCAIETRDVVEVRKIIERHRDTVRDTKGLEKRTALHHAAENGNPQVCEILLNYGADVNQKDARQQTPLWLAASKGNIDICYLLINREADTYFLDQCQLLEISNKIKDLLHCWKDSRGRKFSFLYSFIFRVLFIFIINFLLIENAIDTCLINPNTTYYHSDYENS